MTAVAQRIPEAFLRNQVKLDDSESPISTTAVIENRLCDEEHATAWERQKLELDAICREIEQEVCSFEEFKAFQRIFLFFILADSAWVLHQLAFNRWTDHVQLRCRLVKRLTAREAKERL